MWRRRKKASGEPHCHRFISWLQGLGDGSKRTSGTFAKWLLGSRKAKGKCCLVLFDLYQSPHPTQLPWKLGVGGAESRSRFLCFASHCLWGRCNSLFPFLSLSADHPRPQPAHRDQGPPFKEPNAVMNTRSFSRRWRCPCICRGLAAALGKFREPGVRDYGVP